jgi:hypothetical protein
MPKQINLNQETSTLLSAIRWMLRPLVKLFIAKGITYPQLREILKDMYVEIAEQSFAINNKRASDSRIYVLTGVHRKDIKRLRNCAENQDPEAFKSSTLGGQLVSRWLGLPEYLDADGQPRGLPRIAKEGVTDFEDLVRGVSKDVRPRTILDEWLRQGIVTVNEKDEVCLDHSAFIPQKGFEEKALFLGRHLHDHIASCAHNMMLTDGTPMLERSVYFSSLTKASVEKLRQVASTQAVELLKTINSQALELQQKDANKRDAVQRMRFGTYWFHAEKKKSKEKKS